eukprot:12883304-Prorocentrum_lima.AAC.1
MEAGHPGQGHLHGHGQSDGHGGFFFYNLAHIMEGKRYKEEKVCRVMAGIGYKVVGKNIYQKGVFIQAILIK